jgi:hypothetical protein
MSDWNYLWLALFAAAMFAVVTGPDLFVYFTKGIGK